MLARLNHDQKKIVEDNAQKAQKGEIMTQNAQQPKHATSRRSFMRKGLAVGGAGAIGAGLLAGGISLPAFAEESSSRLTKLMQLTVDTSWWTRYRSRTQNPDFGDTFPQAIPGLSKGQFPAIPRSDADLSPAKHIQAIASTAGFHFGFIE